MTEVNFLKQEQLSWYDEEVLSCITDCNSLYTKQFSHMYFWFDRSSIKWYVCDTLFLAYLNTDSVPQAFASGRSSKAQTCQQNTVVVEEEFMLQLQK